MPHFSGNAQKAIKIFFAKEIDNQGITEFDVETQVKLYYDKIIQTLNG